ncbi:MAG TPA: glycosyltransferase family 4 protein [Azospirillum sp.]
MSDPTIGILGPISLEDYRDHLPERCFAAGYPRGLGGTPVNLMVRELLGRGRRVVVFSLDPSVTEERVFEGDRLRICVGPYTTRRAQTYFKRERRYLLDAIRRERPDLLSAHWTYEFALPAIASGIPHVVTARDAPWRILRRNFIPYRMVRTVMAYHAMRLARRMVAVSPYIADHLHRFGFHSGPIDVIPNGLPEAFFERPAGRPAGRAAEGAPTFASIFSGGWEGLKNGAKAMEAFATVRRSLPAARLLMIGDQCGPDGPAAAWARGRGFDAGIDFLGRLPYAAVKDTLARAADVLVHPSLEESFGMTLIEAAAVGVPAIAGRASGAVSWVLGDCGVLVDVRSSDDIAQAMLHLGTDAGARRRLGEAARTSVRERFSIGKTMDRYEEIFEQLARSGPVGSGAMTAD